MYFGIIYLKLGLLGRLSAASIDSNLQLLQ